MTDQREGAASYARKQEDVTVKNPARGTKNVSERESGVCMCVYVYPHWYSHAQGVPAIARHMAPFFSRRASPLSHTAKIHQFACVCVRTHDDARTDASIKLFEFSIEQKGKFALTRITFGTVLFLLIRNLCHLS